MKTETSKEYADFCEKLVIEEIIKEFNFNCDLTFIGTKDFGGSKIITYYFKDENGITWERDVSYREWFGIACRSEKMRPRIS